MRRRAKMMITMGRTSSKRKLFRSRRMTLNRLRMVAQKWIQN